MLNREKRRLFEYYYAVDAFTYYKYFYTVTICILPPPLRNCQAIFTQLSKNVVVTMKNILQTAEIKKMPLGIYPTDIFRLYIRFQSFISQ